MLKFTLNVAVLGAVSLFVAGCALQVPPQYQPTKLSKEAHAISFSPSKPMGCMLVGEKEGRANKIGTSGATADLLRTGARNDLLNNAVHLTKLGESRRYLVYVAQEIAICDKGTSEVNCNTIPKAQRPEPNAYRVYGDIYECKW